MRCLSSEPLFLGHQDLVQFGPHGCGEWSDLHALQTHCQDYVLWFLPPLTGEQTRYPFSDLDHRLSDQLATVCEAPELRAKGGSRQDRQSSWLPEPYHFVPAEDLWWILHGSVYPQWRQVRVQGTGGWWRSCCAGKSKTKEVVVDCKDFVKDLVLTDLLQLQMEDDLHALMSHYYGRLWLRW